MKRNPLIALAICLALSALAACAPSGSPMDGPDGMPGSVNGVTDVGNPDDEAEIPKAAYANAEFDVVIEYPADWSLDVDDRYEARFSSREGESAAAVFVWLEEGQGFDAFLDEVAGDAADLVMMEHTDFTTFLCETIPAEDDGGMTTSNCYLHGVGEKGEFAMAFAASLYGGIEQFKIIPMERHVRPEKFLVSGTGSPESPSRRAAPRRSHPSRF